jgi:hypothetical protein
MEPSCTHINRGKNKLVFLTRNVFVSAIVNGINVKVYYTVPRRSCIPPASGTGRPCGKASVTLHLNNERTSDITFLSKKKEYRFRVPAESHISVH